MPVSSSRILSPALLAIVPLWAGTLCAQQSRTLFDAPQVQLPDDSPPFQRLGDFDGDGRIDAVGTRVHNTGTQYEVRVWRNVQGQFVQQFNEVNAITNGTGTRMSVAVGDFDNDGDLDFVVGGGTSIFLYTNQGGFAFTRTLLMTTTGVVNDVALGHLDLIYVALSYPSGVVGVRLASGAVLTLPSPLDLQQSARIEVCDLDGDPQPEFGCWSTQRGSFHPYAIANGALTAGPALAPSLVAPDCYSTSGDLDGDGAGDVVCREPPGSHSPRRPPAWRRTPPPPLAAPPP